MNIVTLLLDEIVDAFGDEKTTFQNYIEIFKIGLKSNQLGKIPITADQVVVGDVDRSRSHKVKAIFMVGLNDGLFPSIHKQEGFLDDKNREQLKEFGIELAKGTEEKMYEDQFNIYKAFTTAEEKLFLSYTSSNIEGGALYPSILISKIKKIFPQLYEKSDISNRLLFIGNRNTTFEELLYHIRLFQDGEKIDPIWFSVYHLYASDEEWKNKFRLAFNGLKYRNVPENIDSKMIEELYGNTLKTSISKLEQYRKCPFSFHMKYGLNLQEESTFKINPIDTGSFMHEVIDSFFEYIKNANSNIKEMELEEIKEIVEHIIIEKLGLRQNYIFSSNAKFIYLTGRLKRVIYQSIENIVYQLKNSEFNIFETELEFKQGYKYPPIRLELDNGKKIEVTGKIDRIDIAKFHNKKYVRIIDYKSSVKDIDLNEFVSGLQIQLVTYLDSITKLEDVLPAGVFYYNLIEPMIRLQKTVSEEEIKNEIRKKFKMHGILLADINVIKMMDKNLEDGKASEFIPVYLDSKGNVSEKKSSIIKEEQFKKLQKYANKLIKQISKEILDGDISLKPYYHKGASACRYCSYQSICGFNKDLKENEYRYIDKMNKEEIMTKIEKEVE